MDINAFTTGGISNAGGFYGGGLAGQRFDRKLNFSIDSREKNFKRK
jgi:hypothetical protein